MLHEKTHSVKMQFFSYSIIYVVVKLVLERGHENLYLFSQSMVLKLEIQKGLEN